MGWELKLMPTFAIILVGRDGSEREVERREAPDAQTARTDAERWWRFEKVGEHLESREAHDANNPLV